MGEEEEGDASECWATLEYLRSKRDEVSQPLPHPIPCMQPASALQRLHASLLSSQSLYFSTGVPFHAQLC